MIEMNLFIKGNNMNQTEHIEIAINTIQLYWGKKRFDNFEPIDKKVLVGKELKAMIADLENNWIPYATSNQDLKSFVATVKQIKKEYTLLFDDNFTI